MFNKGQLLFFHYIILYKKSVYVSDIIDPVAIEFMFVIIFGIGVCYTHLLENS